VPGGLGVLAPLIVATAAVVVGLAAAGCDGDDGPTPTTTAASGSLSGSGLGGPSGSDTDDTTFTELAGVAVDKAACSAVTSGTAEEMAERVLGRLSGGRIKGGLLLTTLMASVDVFCPDLFKRAAKAAGRLFRPDEPAEIPSSDDFAARLFQSSPASVAEDLGVTESDVEEIIGDICAEIDHPATR
jgi:hypothetical protein